MSGCAAPPNSEPPAAITVLDIGDTQAESADAASPAPADAQGDAFADVPTPDASAGDVACLVSTLPTSGNQACCSAANLRPLPATATVIDLSQPGTQTAGTCGTYFTKQFPFRVGYSLPSQAAAYPLRVRLPALTGPDPDCQVTCESFEANDVTAFGIALQTDGLIGGDTGRLLAIYVPPPWYFVSGGCGEACPWPCLSGYQEFGVRSCITLAHGDFGFATGDPTAPSVEAVIDLISAAKPFELAPNDCCLFAQ